MPFWTYGWHNERGTLGRAKRFVKRWQDLQGQRQELYSWRHTEARANVESQMSSLAKTLECDPQVESILRSRGQELGISHICREQKIARELERQLTQSRGLGMER